MLVVGDREIKDGTVAVRLRTEEDVGAMHVADFIGRVESVVDAKNGL
jgi:threonyl-tRNA synthetase